MIRVRVPKPAPNIRFRSSVAEHPPCKMKTTDYHREVWYPKNRKRRLELNYAWRKENRQKFQDYKKTLKCLLCGETETSCLDFHHLDPSHKDAAVGDLYKRNWSFERMKQEISKCVVLCSNCHRKVHAGVAQLSEPLSCKQVVEG